MASVFPQRPLIALTALLPGLASAQNAAPSADLGGNLTQLLFGLAVVIALLLGSLWLLKKLSAPRGEAAGLLRVVAGTAVGPRERVVIVEVGGSWMVLGVAPGQVNALAEIPRINIPAQPSKPPANPLTGWLSRMTNRHAR